MRDNNSLAYQLRAQRQRLRGIEAEQHDGFTFEGVADRNDTQEEIKRLEKLFRKEQRDAFNEQQLARLQHDLFA